MHQTQYNLLFRWFIGVAMDDVIWVPNLTRLHSQDKSVCRGWHEGNSARNARGAEEDARMWESISAACQIKT